MEEFLKGLLENTSGLVAYGLVFGILLACGLGVPMPEDISLILGGFLVYEARAELLPMMLTGYLGILTGDTLIFFAGRRMGSDLGKRPGLVQRIITPAKRARVEALFARHGEKIVFIARFLPGVRAVTYFTAGSVGMKYTHFAFYDSVAALASAPAFVYLGYHFGGELEYLIKQIHSGQRGVLALLVTVGAAYVGFKWWKKRREEAAERARLAAGAGVGAVGASASPRPELLGAPLSDSSAQRRAHDGAAAAEAGPADRPS